jgi:hypothetical protein
MGDIGKQVLDDSLTVRGGFGKKRFTGNLPQVPLVGIRKDSTL